ncbi:hypothetical protein ACFW9N_40365 [Streptomyces sp. NPDC059496]|uniref:hypothetical protein n=1 Tax=Streptomyces sp. NPDC059496 TaxID=3346851 RepID=UPI0036983B32
MIPSRTVASVALGGLGGGGEDENREGSGRLGGPRGRLRPRGAAPEWAGQRPSLCLVTPGAVSVSGAPDMPARSR